MHKKTDWLTVSFLVQLVFVFFIPPFELYNRTIFVSDLWCWLWVSTYLIFEIKKKNYKIFTSISILVSLFFVILLHGSLRPPMTEGIYMSSRIMIKDSNDLFNFKRELIIALRFLSWILAGKIVLATNHPKQRLDLISKFHRFLLVSNFLILLIERFSKNFKTALGAVFLFDPYWVHWHDRQFGVFRSPVEAGQAMLLMGVIALSNKFFSKNEKIIYIMLSILSVYLTFSATPIVSLVVAIPIVLIISYRKKIRKNIKWSVVPILILLILAIIHPEHLKDKLIDLNSRTGEWSYLIELTTNKFNLFLFGLGFIPYHTDNSYLFVFSRGGIALFSLIIALFFFLYENKKKISSPQWLWMSFVFISGFALDSFIYRHAVMIIIILALPILSNDLDGYCDQEKY